LLENGDLEAFDSTLTTISTTNLLTSSGNINSVNWFEIDVAKDRIYFGGLAASKPFLKSMELGTFNHFENSIDITSICEVGGGSNPLFEYFKNTNIQYSILDLYESTSKNKSILYKVGNCESYNSYSENSVILSHTFEHLYNPINFLKNISKSTVQNIFVSVPNLNSWLINKLTVNILFNQHTFYFEKEQLFSLFATYGYNIKDYYLFKNHSVFLHFVRSNSLESIIKPISVEESLYRHFSSKEETIRKIKLTTNAYIMPSFYIGLIIYHYLNDKHKIIGFLDNDSNKCGKRLYGTPLITYSPSILAELRNISVIIAITPYFDEIYKQLKVINPYINIISIIV
jgi:hypothetical protein